MKYWGIVVLSLMMVFCFFILFYSTGMGIGIYNKIINAYQNVKEAVANLDTEYQRRYALVDNLLAIVKETRSFEQYVMNFEKEIYTQVAEAKAGATKLDVALPEQIQQRIKKENNLGNILTTLLDKILVMAQHYPQISDPQIKEHTETIKSLQQLRQELKDIEQNILLSRQSLNAITKYYNVQIKIFPANIIANLSGYGELDFFGAINEEARGDAKIKF